MIYTKVYLGENISLGLIYSLAKQSIVNITSEMIPCYLCKLDISKPFEVLLPNQRPNTMKIPSIWNSIP